MSDEVQKMEFAAIIQARRGSSRFPNKVIKHIERKPMLFHVIKRVQKADLISKVYLATTLESQDIVLGKIALAAGIDTFFGATDDVLDRYYQAAIKFRLSHIVRITADCPLIDPVIINSTIKKFTEGSYDYLSNSLIRTFPDGLNTEVLTFEALEKAWIEAKWTSEREHVTPYIWKNPKLFRLGKLLNHSENSSQLRWSVDYDVDLILVRAIYRRLYSLNPYFGYADILELLKKCPQLNLINGGITINEGYEKSIKEDKIVSRRLVPKT